MLKNSESTESLTWPKKGRVRVGGDSRAAHDKNELDGSEINDNKIGSSKVDDEVGKKGRNLSKSKKTELSFLIFGARRAFTKLKQAFIKAPILHQFNPERHIRVKTDLLGYTIGGVLSQLISDNLGRWHLMAFFFQKMIPAETRYKIYNGKLLAIIEAFKTWKYYLEGSQHEVFMLTNHNNLRWFMDTKSLSSRQVR